MAKITAALVGGPLDGSEVEKDAGLDLLFEMQDAGDGRVYFYVGKTAERRLNYEGLRSEQEAIAIIDAATNREGEDE